MSVKVQWALDDKRVAKLAKQAPVIAYEHIREFLFKSWHTHRMEWLKTKNPKFGRGGKGVKVYLVGKDGKRTYKTVHYTLTMKRKTSKSSVGSDFEKLSQAEIRADSLALKLLETGGKTKAVKGRYMTIPVRHRARTIEHFKQRYPKRAKGMRRIKRGDKQFIYQVTGKRKPKAKLIFIQTPRVKNRPTLRFYSSWNVLSHRRDRDWGQVANDIHQDMKKVLRGKST